MNFKKNLSTYLPGILLFFFAAIIGILTYRDYGIAWDESAQRNIGTLCYNYVFNGDNEFLGFTDRQYGTGFELPLVIIEKLLKITDFRDVYLMRHWVTHIFFLFSALSAYVLFYKLYKNQFIASLGFIMLVFCPRIYAHSFFNTKDIPFLCLFIITLSYCYTAFNKTRVLPFFILGLLCGYTTGIRIMGIMLTVFILFLLLIDLISNYLAKKEVKRNIICILVFLIGFCAALYLSMPYLWHSPVHNFIECYSRMSHFSWGWTVFINGKMEQGDQLPWTYFPTWFLISNPILWLISGISGILLLIISFIKKPITFFQNSPERNLVLYLFCFVAPILAIIILHAVIYDDWRHLYFVYPPFVLLALYFINRVINTRYKLIMQLLCVIQIGFLGYFMVRNHPFQEVYFNELVSHKKEYLRQHYEMDYWGCSMKQALDHLIKTNPDATIKVSSDFAGAMPLKKNILMLKEQDRKRVEYVDANDAHYFITDFRGHPDDYPYPKIDYSITVLNSTISCIYKTHE